MLGTASADNLERGFADKWKQQQLGESAADRLALRFMETATLLCIAHYWLKILLTRAAARTEDAFSDTSCTDASSEIAHYELLERRLMDLSEGMGLIRALLDDRDPDMDSSMDIDSFVDAPAPAINKHGRFEAYLLSKFRAVPRISDIVELVAERCGMPLDTDEETLVHVVTNETPTEAKSRNRGNVLSPSTQHWRRVKPLTMPTKRVSTSLVRSSSSLADGTISKMSRFSSTSRQIDFAPNLTRRLSTSAPHAVPFKQSNHRQTEASASQVFQCTTPTKTLQPTRSAANATADVSVIVLETPPRGLSRNALSHLTGSARTLFPLRLNSSPADRTPLGDT